MEKFTAVFEQDGSWWIGYVEELPGANTQGRTIEEARQNLTEAVQLVLEDWEDRIIVQEWLEERAAGEVEMIPLEELEKELVTGGLL